MDLSNDNLDSSNDNDDQNQTKNLKRKFDHLYAKPNVEQDSPAQEETLIANLVPRRFASFYLSFFNKPNSSILFFCPFMKFGKNYHKNCVFGFHAIFVIFFFNNPIHQICIFFLWNLARHIIKIVFLGSCNFGFSLQGSVGGIWSCKKEEHNCNYGYRFRKNIDCYTSYQRDWSSY